MPVRLLIAVLLWAVGAAAAEAKPPGQGKAKGKDKDKDKDKVVVVDHDRRVVVFTHDHRDHYRGYWRETYGPGCPPGLAKKNNGCLPPGQARKRYVVGQRLPRTVVVDPLPDILVKRIGPAPAGYEYAIVDGDLVKLAVGTRLVVDAITALVD